MIQMVYEKRNGQLVFRIRTTEPPYKIGDRTSMGWIVKDIRYKYKDKFLTRHDYDNAIDKAWIRRRKIDKFNQKLSVYCKQLIYFFSFMLMARAFLVLNSVTM